MRNVLMLISTLIFISILMFIVFTKADYTKLDSVEALEIGEAKYLEFLWMVDGAFNSAKMEGEFTVNGKKLDHDNIKFTCIYKNKKDNTCVGNNFEESFRDLFASRITYNQVYGDDSGNTWYKYEKGKYLFTNINSCNINRMNLNQKIRLHEINKNELVFYVSYEDNNHQNKERTFILVKENNLWKIDKAHYEDLCEIKYRIG